MNKNPVEFSPPHSVSAVWSMMLPGIGQLMKGQVMAGIIWAVLVGSGYFFFFWPGLILHACCILDAALNKGPSSIFEFKTWPKRLGLLTLVVFLLFYIVLRNGV